MAAGHYREVCKRNKKRAQEILNEWWTSKASSIQEAVDRKEPNWQFQGYKQLRRVLQHGRRPPNILKDREGEVIRKKPERIQRWREHFAQLLNVDSLVDAQQLQGLAEIPCEDKLATPPLFQETLAAIKSLKNGKACFPDGVPVEVIPKLCFAAKRSLHEIICQVWTGRREIPQEWRDSFLVPLPKRGDLSERKNWRGILLTSVLGKIFSKIINAQLVQLFEGHQVLPETQCGFRAGRGTADMVFTLRMAIELARAKKFPLYVLFADLMKAYDSVSRVGLWEIMRRKGVPGSLVELVRAFYDGKQASVAVEGSLSEMFELGTGLGQGCCLAPLLSNVFLSAVMEAWQAKDPDKLHCHYRIDGVLRRHMDEGSLDKDATWEDLMLHELGYADDAAFIIDTYVKWCELVVELQGHYSSWGLTMSVEKTEATVTEGAKPPDIRVQEVEGFDEIKFCDKFKYLGSQITTAQGCEVDI